MVDSDDILALNHYNLDTLNYAYFKIRFMLHQPHCDATVALKLLLNARKMEIVLRIVAQLTRRLQVTDNLHKSEVLILIEMVLNQTNKLDADALVLERLVFAQSYSHFSSDIFSILEV